MIASYWFWVPYISLHLPCSTAEWPMSGQVTAGKVRGQTKSVKTSQGGESVTWKGAPGGKEHSRRHLGGASGWLHLPDS